MIKSQWMSLLASPAILGGMLAVAASATEVSQSQLAKINPLPQRSRVMQLTRLKVPNVAKP
ncbi:MAG: hypothetical protein JO235_06510, partial [Chroococcidiopsidaceae cyanobacterium CP_BM_RX_35]|nr:hypothetical protein [Chroococcidiopsidaceae cyanobacterium CP_BM_RX_35]